MISSDGTSECVTYTRSKVQSLYHTFDTECEKAELKTIFLEANDAYALGCYGLYHLDYAKMISARWSQLLNRQDEFAYLK